MTSESILQHLLCLMAMASAEISQELYTVVHGYRLTNTPMCTVDYKPTRRFKAWCLQHCLALSCASASFRQTDGICELHSLKLYDGDSRFVESDDWIYMEPRSDVLTWDEWTVVFRAQKHTWTPSYLAWKNDSIYHDHPLLPPRLQPACFSPNTLRPCGDHFRSKIMSTWEAAGIKLVKVLLMKNSRVRKEIIFDGTGTTKMSWFTETRVVNSTWTDLNTSTFNRFSIKGHPNNRRFMISNSYYGCPNDVLWMIVIDEDDVSHPCDWDHPANAPKFLYTRKNTKRAAGDLTAMRVNQVKSFTESAQSRSFVEKLSEKPLHRVYMQCPARPFTFGKTASSILHEYYSMPKIQDPEKAKLGLIETASKLIASDIKSMTLPQHFYPSSGELANVDEHLSPSRDCGKIFNQPIESITEQIIEAGEKAMNLPPTSAAVKYHNLSDSRVGRKGSSIEFDRLGVEERWQEDPSLASRSAPSSKGTVIRYFEYGDAMAILVKTGN
ncbi:uncharacterized protein [Haliotis asinina]|uniref:uncharacterized protein n=1 Tax=Haliotis asinina TaxID=109174 RepID=UPI003531A4C7